AIEVLQKQAEAEWLKYPKKFYHGLQNVDVKGDYVYHSKNTDHAFLVTDVEDSKFIALIHSKPTKDCYDYTDWGENVQLIYDSIAVGLGAQKIKFGMLIFADVREIEYSFFCGRSQYLFGCAGLKDKKYCILNKQYTKEEYEEMVPKIKKHMDDMPYIDKKGRVYKYGEFFPLELSPFAYNEAVVQEYFTITEDQADVLGVAWKKPDTRNINITKKYTELPDTISDVNDNILKDIIECQHQGKCNEHCTTAFRIIPQELEFYRKQNLPLPRLCPNCRHYQRLKQRNPLKLWKRKCQKDGCNNEFETSYAPDRPEIVYCEQCYNKEVV
ncbi:hypothetical protein ACFL3E_00955, partial [Patescibacteria group bacterium]